MKRSKFLAFGLYFYWMLLIDIGLLIGSILLTLHIGTENFATDITVTILLWIAWIAWKLILIRCTKVAVINQEGITIRYLGRKKQFLSWHDIKEIEAINVFFVLRQLYISTEKTSTIEKYSLRRDADTTIIISDGVLIRKAIKRFYFSGIKKQEENTLKILFNNNNILIEDSLELLKRISQFISMDYEEQIKIIPNSINKNNPLQLSGIWYKKGAYENFNELEKIGIITEKAKEVFNELDQNFDSVPVSNKEFANSIWTIESMKIHEFWAKQRIIAKALFEELSKIELLKKD